MKRASDYEAIEKAKQKREYRRLKRLGLEQKTTPPKVTSRRHSGEIDDADFGSKPIQIGLWEARVKMRAGIL